MKYSILGLLTLVSFNAFAVDYSLRIASEKEGKSGDFYSEAVIQNSKNERADLLQVAIARNQGTDEKFTSIQYLLVPATTEVKTSLSANKKYQEFAIEGSELSKTVTTTGNTTFTEIRLLVRSAVAPRF